MLAAALRRQRRRWAFWVLIALTLLVTPLRSRFHVRAGFVCEVGAPVERWVGGVLNAGHLITYGVLVLVGKAALRELSLAKVGALVFALSAAIELQQAMFTVGHCRVRDLLPNLVAVVLAGGGHWAITRSIRPAISGTK